MDPPFHFFVSISYLLGSVNAGGGTDCCDQLAHRLAMTGYEKISVIPRSGATWESVFLVGQGPCALPEVRRKANRRAGGSPPYGQWGNLRRSGAGRRGRRPLRASTVKRSVGAAAHIGPAAPALKISVGRDVLTPPHGRHGAFPRPARAAQAQSASRMGTQRRCESKAQNLHIPTRGVGRTGTDGTSAAERISKPWF